jgi:hypothetical protein
VSVIGRLSPREQLGRGCTQTSNEGSPLWRREPHVKVTIWPIVARSQRQLDRSALASSERQDDGREEVQGSDSADGSLEVGFGCHKIDISTHR